MGIYLYQNSLLIFEGVGSLSHNPLSPLTILSRTLVRKQNLRGSSTIHPPENSYRAEVR